MIRNISQFSDDVRMGFGIDKCKKLTIQHGKIAQMENIQLNNGEELKSLELNQQYNARLITDKTTKSALRSEYFKRL